MAKKKTKEEEVLKNAEKATKEAEKTIKSVEDKARDVVFSAIKKKYGNVMAPLSAGTGNIKTVSTGSLGLDMALGRGGMAFGRIYEVFGPNSGGKSTLAVHVVIQAQRRGLKCAYIDAEQAVDYKLFENYGVDSQELDLIQAYGGEPNLDICESLIRTGLYSVIVVDSVSALIPKAEAEADMDKDQMALQARLMSKALRKITPQAADHGTLIIFVNQLRMKVGGYGNPETTSGGEALGFWATGRISVRGPEAKSRRLVDAAGVTYGHKSEFEIVKNKLGEPFKKTSLDLIYGKGYDIYSEVLDLAVSLDIVEKNGSWFSYNEKKLAQGTINSIETLKQNSDLFKEIRESIIDTVGLKEPYELHSNPGPLYSS
jgi:recombination protein RecA